MTDQHPAMPSLMDATLEDQAMLNEIWTRNNTPKARETIVAYINCINATKLYTATTNRLCDLYQQKIDMIKEERRLAKAAANLGPDGRRRARRARRR